MRLLTKALMSVSLTPGREGTTYARGYSREFLYGTLRFNNWQNWDPDVHGDPDYSGVSHIL